MLIGVESYCDPELGDIPSAAQDVLALEKVLGRHHSQEPHFEITRKIVGRDSGWTASDLLALVHQKMQGSKHFLFYFSGHGVSGDFGLQLATPEKSSERDSGVYFSTLLHRFNQARCEVTVILDCCHSGAAADMSFDMVSSSLMFTNLRQGVTILASSDREQDSYYDDEYLSHFTKFVVGCLSNETNESTDIVDVYRWTRRELIQQIPVLRTFGSRFSPLRSKNEQAFSEDTSTGLFPVEYVKNASNRGGGNEAVIEA
ncbi:caspase family protein [Curtobacterium sp. MCLR17_044]|uniref:caspase family protein n=1 Tax=Curtobacterium sp. MCLR17_044 TaxID=2175628 RepID=UPI0015E8C37D|nr:caspase family protein [Curtobacterium sp. MCLR17_044]